MCLIERLPTKIIDFPIAYTGDEYFGIIGPMEVTKCIHDEPAKGSTKKELVIMLPSIEADMGVPTHQMHANLEPMNEPARVYNSHSKKRMLQKHRRLSIRRNGLKILQ
jgi:hypothetical protein